MKKRIKEKLVCAAAAQFLAKRAGSTASIHPLPGEDDIDLRFQIDSIEYVVEHTLIEPFPDSITYQKRLWQRLRPFVERLSGTMPPPGQYQLLISVEDLPDFNFNSAIEGALEKWIRAKAPSLKLGCPSNAPYHFIEEILEGVPFRAKLSRWPDYDGRLDLLIGATEKVESLRQKRMEKSLGDKCIKLKIVRGNSTRSVLVLESNDIQLSNTVLISKAFNSLVEKFSKDLPDQVCLVETDGAAWYVWLLKDDTNLYPGISDHGPYEVVRNEL